MTEQTDTLAEAFEHIGTTAAYSSYTNAFMTDVTDSFHAAVRVAMSGLPAQVIAAAKAGGRELSAYETTAARRIAVFAFCRRMAALSEHAKDGGLA